MSEKVVVTGGCGFIGSALAEALAEKGFKVTVFDNLSTGYLKNLENARDSIEFAEGDIRNYAEISNAVEGAKFVFHMAALSYVGESMKIPEAYNNVNIDGTLNVLKACKEQSVRRFLFPSTCIVYGNPLKNPVSESASCAPTSPYGLTKVVGEFFSKFYFEEHNLETIVLRIFNAYGPRMQKRVVSNFAIQLLDGTQPSINGNGLQQRDFIFVSDIVQGFLNSMDVGKKSCGKVFNIGTGKPATLNELVEKISKHYGLRIQPKHLPDVNGEIFRLLADTSLAKKELDFTAKTGLAKGLKLTLDWIKANRKI